MYGSKPFHKSSGNYSRSCMWGSFALHFALHFALLRVLIIQVAITVCSITLVIN